MHSDHICLCQELANEVDLPQTKIIFYTQNVLGVIWKTTRLMIYWVTIRAGGITWVVFLKCCETDMGMQAVQI